MRAFAFAPLLLAGAASAAGEWKLDVYQSDDCTTGYGEGWADTKGWGCQVFSNPHALKFSGDDYELQLFSDHKAYQRNGTTQVECKDRVPFDQNKCITPDDLSKLKAWRVS